MITVPTNEAKRPRWFRFTLSQVLLLVVLIGLVLGLVMSVIRGPLAQRGQSTRIEWLAFSPDGRTLAAGGFDCTLRLWDLESRRVREDFTFPGSFKSMAFSPDGKCLALGMWDGTVEMWNTTTWERSVFRGHSGPPVKREDGSLYQPWRGVESLAFHPDGTILATGGGDNTARLLDATSGAELAVLRGHTDYVTKVTFSRDGNRVATVSSDKTVRLWDAASGEQLGGFNPGAEFLLGLAANSDGKVKAAASLYSAANGWSIRVWDIESGEEWNAADGNRFGGTIGTFSPEGNLLAVANGSDPVRIWEVNAGHEQAVLTGHTWAMAFSSDGRTLATGHDLGTVRLWDTNSERPIGILQGDLPNVPWGFFIAAFIVWTSAWIVLRRKSRSTLRVTA